MEIQALLIMFREVLEALLLIGIITTYMKRMGQCQYNKFV
ncbi:iron permease, partial [Planococcus sp. SIMBA_143]